MQDEKMPKGSYTKNSPPPKELPQEPKQPRLAPQAQGVTKLPYWQVAISLSSALIALSALGFSIYQGYLQRQFQTASVRPRMTISLFYNNEGAGFMFGGTGIGYATLRTFEVLVDGRPQPNWLEMCRTLGFASAPSFEFVVPRPEAVFKPDSYNKVFWIPAGPQSEELKLKAGRILITACYCSVYDECWKVDSHNSVPQAVHSCPKLEMTFSAPPRQVRLP